MRDLGRLVVVLALCSAAVHITLAVQTAGRSLTTTLLLAAMAGLCMVCLPALWRGGSVHAWMSMLGLTGVMLYVHLEFCLACGPAIHDVAELHLGLAAMFFEQGLGSLALWLMTAEMALAVIAVLGLLVRTAHNNPEVAQP